MVKGARGRSAAESGRGDDVMSRLILQSFEPNVDGIFNSCDRSRRPSLVGDHSCLSAQSRARGAGDLNRGKSDRFGKG